MTEWKYDIQYGPEGEANYAWVYDEAGEMVGTMKTHQAAKIVAAMNEAAMMADMEASFAQELSQEEEKLVQNSWERFCESMPAARVVNDNQDGNRAIIEVLRDPPTLPVGTVLFSSYQGLRDNALTLEALGLAP